MEKGDLNRADANWATCTSNDVQTCFFTFFDSNAPMGFDNQYARILGFEYGTIGKDFLDKVKPDSANFRSLEMLLGVNYTDQPRPETPEFAIIWKLQMDGETEYYLPLSKFYAMSKSNEEGHGRKYGITPMLKNQLCLNWYYTPGNNISSLFYNITPIEGRQHYHQEGPGKGMPIPSDFTYTRVLKYPLREDNLAAFREVVKEDSELKIHLAVNPSDFIEDEQIFSLIIEIINDESGQDSGSTFLEYVGGCPPVC